MEHILDLDQQKSQLHEIFKKIQESNTILFLGAGASVGDKKYLSSEVIDYYESKINKKLNERNITKFVDILSADENFSRNQFDTFVVELLQKLKVTEAHKIMASIPWREIITTNYDLLVERAFDEISQSSRKIYDIKVIKNIKQYNYKESNSEVKYIKLNGCIQDKSLYPLAFSTDDFNKLKTFYKNVLNDLRNLSDSINLLSIGYSFSDDFGVELLEKFDLYNFRDKKWIINVDPYPNENALSYYKQKRICIIKCSFQDFFLKYKEWEDSQTEYLAKRKGLSVLNSNNNYITMPHKLLIDLDGIIKQLNTSTKEKIIKEVDFYKGEEPNFSLITKGVDVIKSKYITKFQSEIESVLSETKTTFIPIFFITGDFGIGKSTFTLRLIYELEKIAELDLIAFEILDFNRLRKEHLIDLINHCKTKNIIFFCDEVEIESYFKSLLDFQRDLSIEQFQDCNVFFVVPIRENILEKHRVSKNIPRNYELKIGGKLELEEIEDLLDKLKKSGLVEFRDVTEKKGIIKRIQSEYSSDSFISLMQIITSGKHENDLINCYNELSKEAQHAFLYTALLHKYKLLMPANWLKQNISLSWDDFITKIIKIEGKGILIQEYKSTHGTQPDLYFRTKHPLIAEKLVNTFIKNKDKRFTKYEEMLRVVDIGQTNSYLVSNLLKAFIKSDEFTDVQINKLYDTAYTRLSDDPHFLLNYAINLQNRRSKANIKKALDLLIYAESLLEKRNHKFIHRRAVLSFDLARLFFQDEKELNFTFLYLKDARELFEVKQLLDPFSSYSYVDYIKMLIWELEHIQLESEDIMTYQILIEELFDTANKTITDGLEKINNLYSNYASYIDSISDKKDYKNYLEEIYDNGNLRPYACILLYNYFESIEDYDSADELISEMEHYQENSEVVKFLFKYYGRNLHNPNIRIKFLKIVKENPTLEKVNPLRYNYFNFIAESYNHNFFDGRNFLHNIQSKYNSINPEFHYIWCDSLGNEVIFDARVIKNKEDKHKTVKTTTLQQKIRLIKGNYDKITNQDVVKVKLHFYLNGLMAEIISSPNNHNEPEGD